MQNLVTFSDTVCAHIGGPNIGERWVAASPPGIKVKVKEADLYSAFIEVPYTQGAQVRLTQCYLQTTPYLPLPRKHSPDGASQTEVADI